MGQSFSASIHFGVVLPEEYLYHRYEENDNLGEHEYPSEALESEIDKLAEGTNLTLAMVGYWDGDETTQFILALKEPTFRTGYGDDYYIKEFSPQCLSVGNKNAEAEGRHDVVAAALGLDWSDARWLLCWSVS